MEIALFNLLKDTQSIIYYKNQQAESEQLVKRKLKAVTREVFGKFSGFKFWIYLQEMVIVFLK